MFTAWSCEGTVGFWLGSGPRLRPGALRNVLHYDTPHGPAGGPHHAVAWSLLPGGTPLASSWGPSAPRAPPPPL